MVLEPERLVTRGAVSYLKLGSRSWQPAARQDSDNISVFRFNLATGKLEWTGNEHCGSRLSFQSNVGKGSVRLAAESRSVVGPVARYEVPSPNFVCNVVPHQPGPLEQALF